jgi:hypothetical protein
VTIASCRELVVSKPLYGRGFVCPEGFARRAPPRPLRLATIQSVEQALFRRRSFTPRPSLEGPLANKSSALHSPVPKDPAATGSAELGVTAARTLIFLAKRCEGRSIST